MDILEQQIDFSRIPIQKVRKWVSSKIESVLGVQDEIFINYCVNQLKYKTRKSAVDEESQISPKELISNIEGFLGENAREFVVELWDFLSKLNKLERNNYFQRIDKNENTYLKRKRSFINKNLRQNESNTHQSLFKYEVQDKYESKFYNRERDTYNRQTEIRKNNLASKNTCNLLLEMSKENKVNRTRNRSLSRSLSPETCIRCDTGVQSCISNFLDPKYSDSPVNRSEPTPSGHLEKSGFFGMSSSHNKLPTESNSKVQINSKFNTYEQKSSDNDIEQEQLLRMKALELIKRKSYEQRKGNRTESEEILRARALEKLIKRKPTNKK